MVITKKRWNKLPADKQLIRQLQEELKIHPVLCQILVQRGITDYESAERFFRPKLAHLYDPFLMQDMEKAVLRLEKAIKNNEKVLVYGDYDVDGTTSVALMYNFLKEELPQLDFYIPDRYKEGYGISYDGIDFAADEDFSLIIALDCGITAIEQVEYASEKGIDFIICDHHRPGRTIPKAAAVLDPKRDNCLYPYKELSGCGIGFKLLQAYVEKNDLSFDRLEEVLDFVAVSIASDIVPITDENRILAYYGIKKLNKNPSPGIKAIIELTGLENKELNITDIVFKIGPRINAAGRMTHAKEAVKSLIAGQKNSMLLAEVLHKSNSQRKDLDTAITEEALSIIKEDEVLVNRKSTVLYRPYWHKGVIGIVASRLMESYYRPTIVLTSSNGMVTGSARSVRGFDVYDAISSCSELLEQFGGHTYAAGLTMKEENVEQFIEKFEEVVCATIDESILQPEITIDAELDLKEITPSFYNILRQMAPFGPGNMRPVFLIRNLQDAGYTKIVKEKHIKMAVRRNGSPVFKGIAFNMSSHYPKIKEKEIFDLCCNLNENHWNGKVYLEFNVKDIRFE